MSAKILSVRFIHEGWVEFRNGSGAARDCRPQCFLGEVAKGFDHSGMTISLLSLQVSLITRFQPSKRLREQDMQLFD